MQLVKFNRPPQETDCTVFILQYIEANCILFSGRRLVHDFISGRANMSLLALMDEKR